MTWIERRRSQYGPAWLMLALTGLVGCCPETDEGPSAAVEKSPTEQTLTSANRADLARVHVLFYGLMAFAHDNSTGTHRIWALLPPDADHNRALHRGKYLGSNSWKWVPAGWTLDDTISIVFDPALNPPVPVTIKPYMGAGFPKRPEEARDARWMLNAKEIADQDLSVAMSGARLKMLIDSGEFETCGLVHASKTSTVCTVTAGKAKRAMSEYMVLHWEIPKTTKVFVKIGARTHPLLPTGDSEGGYSQRYDLALTNLADKDIRLPRTDHLEIVRSKIFPSASGNWKSFSYDSPCGEVQAPCIDRYDGWGGSPSGGDRPLCPFVAGGP